MSLHATHPPARPATSRQWRGAGFLHLTALVVFGIMLCAIPTAHAALGEAVALQDIDDETFADRPIAEVNIDGLKRVEERLVRNNLRTAAGQPFEAASLRDDVATMYRLGQFETVTADAELLEDGSVKVTYRVTEQALIKDVQTVGNSRVSDQELRKDIPLYRGSPRDDFLVEQSVLRIKNLYRSKGYYLAEVTVDETRLKDAGLLIFKIVEGPRVRIKEIEFIGNDSFRPSELGSKIKTKPAIPFFRKGELDTELLIDDTATIDKYYRDRGFIDVRVDHRVLLSRDSKEAKVVFVIDEGREYRLRKIEIATYGAGDDSPLTVFNNEQLVALAMLRPGAVVTSKRIEKTVESIRNAYLQMGYLDIQVRERTIRVGEAPEVDLFLEIVEGSSFDAGLVLIQGNFITKDKIIRRLVRILPGRPLNGATMEDAKIRLQNSQLFNDVRITVQQPSEDQPDVRDVIVEIKERNTGSFNFGVGFGSDQGVFGEFSVKQNNFDIADFPLSADELLAGRAFRGAGQNFNLTVAPGNEIQYYSLSLTEPHLFESNISGTGSFFYQRRIYNQYDEDRLNASITVGQRLGDVWVGSIETALERVHLTNFDGSTPVEVAADAGPDIFLGVSASLRRTTVDNIFRPSKGSVLNASISKFFGIKGDVDFMAVTGGVTSFLTLYEDFLGRKQVLRLKTNFGWIFSGNAPTYERFYLGGRTLRGFAFRTVSPKAKLTLDGSTQNNEPIGGTWQFFAGAQYEVPLFTDSFTGVLFMDSGTVVDTPGFDDYRLSVGVGIRMYIPQLGPTPLAFDFGFPILIQDEDQRQLFSFTAELPF
jgi:outer membrane protein insertion porin family